MNGKRILVVAHKEWREIIRDRLFFSLAFMVPAFLMILLGYGISLDVENIPFVVMDQDGSKMSREYSYRFIDSRYFDFKGYTHDEHTLKRLLTDNKVRAAMIIPEHFQKDLLSGRPVHVQTLIDGTFPFRAQTTKGYVTAISTAMSRELLAGYLSRTKGISNERASGIVQPVKLEVRYLYNQSVKSIWSVAPKLIMVIMMLSPPFLTALGVVREKESGSIYNIYASTVRRGEFLLGKLLPYVVISTMNMLILWLMATKLYGAPFKGQALFFVLSSILYVICTTGIGLVASLFVRTQIAAIIVTIILTMIPAVLYSGCLIPISSLSGQAQTIAHMLPAMYYTNIVTGSFLKGVGFKSLWPNVLILMGYATVLFTIGFAQFSKRPRS